MQDRLITTPGLYWPERPGIHGTPLADSHGDFASIGPFYGIDLNRRHMGLALLQSQISKMNGIHLADFRRLDETGHKSVNVNFFAMDVGPEEAVPPVNFWRAFEPQYTSVMELMGNNRRLMMINSGTDLQNCLSNDKMGLWLSVEGLYGEGTETLDIFKQLRDKGVLSAMLTHNPSNHFGGGPRDPERPLSGFGKDAIPASQEAGVILDLAHLGKQSKDDLVRLTENNPEKPNSLLLINSHTGFAQVIRERGVQPHPRCIELEDALDITNRGGFVGLAIEVATFMVEPGGKRGVRAIQDQVEYGLKHGIRMTFGADRGGVSPNAYMGLGPVDESMPLIIQGLIDMGCTDQQIRDIAGEALIKYHERYFAAFDKPVSPAA